MRRVNGELVTVYNAKREMWSDVHEEYHTVTVHIIICLYKRNISEAIMCTRIDHLCIMCMSIYMYVSGKLFFNR